MRTDFLSNVTCKFVDLDTQDVIVTTPPSSTKTLVVVKLFQPPVCFCKISIACNISPCSSAVSYPLEKCHLEDSASVMMMQQLIGIVQQLGSQVSQQTPPSPLSGPTGVP